MSFAVLRYRRCLCGHIAGRTPHSHQVSKKQPSIPAASGRLFCCPTLRLTVCVEHSRRHPMPVLVRIVFSLLLCALPVLSFAAQPPDGKVFGQSVRVNAADTSPRPFGEYRGTEQSIGEVKAVASPFSSRSYIAASGGYSGNTSSGIFHRSSCRYYNCKRCTVHFSSRDAAVKAGYRPCRVCRP